MVTSASKCLKPSVDNTILLRRISHNIQFSSSSFTPTAINTTTTTWSDDLRKIDFGTFTGLASSHTTSIIDNKSISNTGQKKSLESLLSKEEKKKARVKELKEN